MLSTLLGKIFGDLPSSFAFSIGEKLNLPNAPPSVFTLWNACSKSADKFPAVAFIFDKRSDHSEDLLQMARNCLNKMKTFRHPHVLKVFEAIEVPSGIYVVTESVRPLACCVDTLPTDLSWAMYQLTSALAFIHGTGNSVHAGINPFIGVFVTSKGEWRLGGFDLTVMADRSLMSEILDSSLRHPAYMKLTDLSCSYFPTHVPPAAHGRVADYLGLANLAIWSRLNAEAKGCPPGSNARSTVPKDLATFVQALNEQPVDLPAILKSCDFFVESSVVQVMLFFEQFSLKGNWEKEIFFGKLSETLDQLPIEVQIRQLLPELINQVHSNGVQPTMVLGSILKIGEHLALDSDMYKQWIIPTICHLFKSSDRAVRFALLQTLSSYDAHIDGPTAAVIYDSLALGFTDSSAPLRELTLKSMTVFMPKLIGHIQEKAVKQITKLIQEDREHTIRTNSVVALAKVADSLPTKQLYHVVAGFCAGLKDGYIACRLSSLQAIGATASLFSAQDISLKLIPAACQRFFDSDPAVKGLAFQIVDHLLVNVKKNLMQDGAEKPVVLSSPSMSWADWAIQKATILNPSPSDVSTVVSSPTPTPKKSSARKGPSEPTETTTSNTKAIQNSRTTDSKVVQNSGTTEEPATVINVRSQPTLPISKKVVDTPRRTEAKRVAERKLQRIVPAKLTSGDDFWNEFDALNAKKSSPVVVREGIFGGGDDDDQVALPTESSEHALLGKLTSLDSKLDPTLFEYDAVFDEISSRTEVIDDDRTKLLHVAGGLIYGGKAQADKKKSQFIDKLITTGKRREIEQDIVQERALQKQAERDESLAGKDVFVTSAYAKRLEERRMLELELAERDRQDEARKVTSLSDVSGIHRRLLDSGIASRSRRKEEIMPSRASTQWQGGNVHGKEFRPARSDDLGPLELAGNAIVEAENIELSSSVHLLPQNSLFVEPPNNADFETRDSVAGEYSVPASADTVPTVPTTETAEEKTRLARERFLKRRRVV